MCVSCLWHRDRRRFRRHAGGVHWRCSTVWDTLVLEIEREAGGGRARSFWRQRERQGEGGHARFGDNERGRGREGTLVLETTREAGGGEGGGERDPPVCSMAGVFWRRGTHAFISVGDTLLSLSEMRLRSRRGHARWRPPKPPACWRREHVEPVPVGSRRGHARASVGCTLLSLSEIRFYLCRRYAFISVGGTLLSLSEVRLRNCRGHARASDSAGRAGTGGGPAPRRPPRRAAHPSHPSEPSVRDSYPSHHPSHLSEASVRFTHPGHPSESFGASQRCPPPSCWRAGRAGSGRPGPVSCWGAGPPGPVRALMR